MVIAALVLASFITEIPVACCAGGSVQPEWWRRPRHRGLRLYNSLAGSRRPAVQTDPTGGYRNWRAPDLSITRPKRSYRAQSLSSKSRKSSAPFRAQEFYNAALVRSDARANRRMPQRLFRQSADLGDTNAMKELGESYDNGEGVTKDDLEALRWFLRAAGGGNTAAMLSLGGMYLFGSDAVPQSDDEAVRWFQKAADLRNPAGMYDLARIVRKRPGRSQEYRKGQAAVSGIRGTRQCRGSTPSGRATGSKVAARSGY